MHRSLIQAPRWPAPPSCCWLPAAPWAATVSPMSFFVTSVGPGKGGDLGGLAGADAHCQKLATAAGAGGRTWRAYLSTSPRGSPGVNARDRIGKGPWQNAKGVVIAANVANCTAPTTSSASRRR
jgi:hypothetical protein